MDRRRSPARLDSLRFTPRCKIRGCDANLPVMSGNCSVTTGSGEPAERRRMQHSVSMLLSALGPTLGVNTVRLDEYQQGDLLLSVAVSSKISFAELQYFGRWPSTGDSTPDLGTGLPGAGRLGARNPGALVETALDHPAQGSCHGGVVVAAPA